jgi:hypothetical protein
MLAPIVQRIDRVMLEPTVPGTTMEEKVARRVTGDTMAAATFGREVLTVVLMLKLQLMGLGRDLIV